MEAEACAHITPGVGHTRAAWNHTAEAQAHASACKFVHGNFENSQLTTWRQRTSEKRQCCGIAASLQESKDTNSGRHSKVAFWH